MAYEVTATRKRPQTLEDLTGQEFVASTLANSLKTGRIAHAYLFSGPRGVGKTSAARILAKSLNCENGPTEKPCGICASCVEITRGNSLDVIEIDGASNTSVNDVREIKDEVLFTPNSSRYKVYIIDEVHMLSNSAFNALLKTIEEPPPYIVFIFATTELHKVPATIKSRCQHFSFRLIAPEAIRALLRGICGELGLTAEEDALYWIAKEATGSLRDAYTLFDQVVAFSEGTITLAGIREKLGLVGLESLNEFAELLLEENGGAALSYLDDLLSRGVSVEQFVIDLAEYFRNLLFLKSGVDRESVLGVSPDRFSARCVGEFTVGQVEKSLELVLQLYRNIRYSLDQRFELELLVSRLSSIRSFFTHRELLAQLKELGASVPGVPRAAATTRPGLTYGGNPGSGSARVNRGASTNSPTPQSGAGSVSSRTTPVPPATRPAERRENAYDGPVRNDGPQRGSVEPPRASVSVSDEQDDDLDRYEAYTDPADRGEERAESTERSGGADRSEELHKGGVATAVAPAVAPPPTDLLKRLADSLRGKKLALASALEKAASYSLDGDNLSLVFTNPFPASFVRQELPTVSEKVAEIIGRQVRVSAEVRESAPQAAAGRDDHAEMVRKVFRGQILSGE